MTDTFKTYFDGEVFVREARVDFRDCDRNERLKLSSVLHYAADAAGGDYAARGFTHRRLLDMRQVFLLSRVSFRAHDLPGNDDRLILRTWERGVQAVFFMRDYEFLGGDGRVKISASSAWLLVDPVTRRILRPSAFTARAVNRIEARADCPACDKVAPRGDAAACGAHRVTWSDLDGNGHLYSARYGDVVSDCLPDTRCPDEFLINYAHEARLNDTIDLSRGGEAGETLSLYGSVKGEPCFSCEAKWRVRP